LDHIDRGTFDKKLNLDFGWIWQSCNWVSMSKCHSSLVNNQTEQTRISFGYFRYWDSKDTPESVNPTILDFIPENEEETNLSTKLVKKRIRLEVCLILFVRWNRNRQSFFAIIEMLQSVSATLFKRQFILPIIMAEWIKTRESVL
jgi:hypothetical protein